MFLFFPIYFRTRLNSVCCWWWFCWYFLNVFAFLHAKLILVSSSSSLSWWLARIFTIKEILWLNFSHRPLILSRSKWIFVHRSNYFWDAKDDDDVSDLSSCTIISSFISSNFDAFKNVYNISWLFTEVVGGCWWKCYVVLSSLLVNCRMKIFDKQNFFFSMCHRRLLSTSFDTEAKGNKTKTNSNKM